MNDEFRMVRFRLSYLIHYEGRTGRYVARSPNDPLAVGGGKCLSGAVDDLELKIQKLQLDKPSVHKTGALSELVLVVQVS